METEPKQNLEMLESPVVDFYEGRSIFVTGATGFMGKVLVTDFVSTFSIQYLFYPLIYTFIIEVHLRCFSKFCVHGTWGCFSVLQGSQFLGFVAFLTRDTFFEQCT